MTVIGAGFPGKECRVASKGSHGELPLQLTLGGGRSPGGTLLR